MTLSASSLDERFGAKPPYSPTPVASPRASPPPIARGWSPAEHRVDHGATPCAHIGDALLRGDDFEDLAGAELVDAVRV